MKNITIFVTVILLVGLLFGCKEGLKIIVDDSGNRTPVFKLMSAGIMPHLGVEGWLARFYPEIERVKWGSKPFHDNAVQQYTVAVARSGGNGVTHQSFQVAAVK